MPVIKKKLHQEHPDHQAMLEIMIRHLKDKGGDEKFPRIIEDENSLTKSMNVYVFWDRFGSMTIQERAELILEAYENAKGQAEALRISVAMGLTPLEEQTLGLDSPSN